MADHYLRALERLDDAQAARDALRAEYASGYPKAARVAALHKDVDNAMADVRAHSMLYVGQQLADVVSALELRR